jgi:glycine oxidase
MAKPDCLIVGGGIIGASLALELAREKLSVVLLERNEACREASWAAAGMLAPTSEHHEHPALEELARASSQLYPDWLSRLHPQGASAVGYRSEGALVVAFDEAERAVLSGVAGERLTSAELRRVEPALSERVASGVYLNRECQLDTRRLMEVLWQAAADAGAELWPGAEVRALSLASGRVTGVQLTDKSRLEAGSVVDAAGAWAGQLGEAAARLAPTRPIRGQIISLRAKTPPVGRVIRSARAYVVPRADGHLLIGSTMEDAGYDNSVTPAGLARLLAGVQEILPGAARYFFEEAWAGLRPDTPDHLPILGATDLKNFFVAAGHFRNGILLAPMTARLMAELILGRAPSIPLDPFSPLRFAAAGA